MQVVRKPEAQGYSCDLPRTNFLNWLEIAAPSMGRESALPPMLHFAAMENGGLVAYLVDRLVAFDYVPGLVVGSFPAFSVNFRDCLRQVKALKGGTVSLEWTEGGFLQIKGGLVSTGLPTMANESSYRPWTKEAHHWRGFNMPLPTFAEALPSLLKIVHADSPRNYATAVHLEVKGTTLALVGTDGFRLSVAETQVDVEQQALDGLMIPDKSARSIAAMVKRCVGFSFSIPEDKTTLRVQWEMGSAAYFRLSAVKFPNFRGVLPDAKAPRRTIHVDRKAALAAVRAALLTTDKSKAIEILGTDEGAIIRSRVTKTDPWSTQPIIFSGGFVKHPIALNGEFLAEALDTLPGATVQIWIPEEEEDPITLLAGCLRTVVVPIKRAAE